MNPISNSTKRVHDFNMEYYCIRLTARLCIIAICILTLVPRIMILIADPKVSTKSRLLVVITYPLPVLMGLLIGFEYFLYKKLGPGIVKYSNLVDILLLLFFTADWIIILVSALIDVAQTSPVSWKITTVYGFTTFSWRTLMVTLIVQKWQLKIISPVLAVSISCGFALYYLPAAIFYTLSSAGFQLFNIILILYCEDKVKWKLMWANIQKQKWMQVNDFILNSIPENIMILDLEGEAKFMSEYCKSFLKKFDLSLETKDFFKKVQDLRQQKQDEPQSPSVMERLATAANGLLGENEKNNGASISPQQESLLEDLIVNFKNQIIKKEIDEKQFAIYNGKLKIENHQERSLEVKISFVQHFENYYIILIIRDTTQRDLLIASEETNRYKDQLLASVSHELRAPLNGNINLVESAVNSLKIPHCVKESCLIPALRSSKFLLHMINDILDMSQIKEKKLRLVFNSESLKETLKSTAQLVELQAKKKGIELLLEIDPAIQKSFCTDHIRLSQIILNLLNNAIKFTKEGVVKLAAKPMPESSSVKITVEDSGIGMSQENIQNLFSSYTHIEFEGRQNLNPTGVGLGLNIAYNLALLLSPQGHQGISVTSIPGEGSTFTFIIENQEKVPPELDNSHEIINESPGLAQHLPFSKLQRNHGISSSSALLIEKSESNCPLNSPCKCPKIMVVDDNPFNTMAFETILSSFEVKCDSVYSGSSCIKSLLDRQSKVCGANCQQYAVVFMDQEMPEMSGSDTVHEIKRLQEEKLLSQDIQVIGCTAHKSKQEVDKFIEAGTKQCIHKPISVSMIQEILKDIAFDV